MRLRDLHDCDGCGHAVAGLMPDGKVQVLFYVVRLSAAVVNLQAVNSHLGLAQMLGGHHRLAEAFTPYRDVAEIVGDQPGSAWDEALLCLGCYTRPGLSVGELSERVAARTARVAAARAASASRATAACERLNKMAAEDDE